MHKVALLESGRIPLWSEWPPGLLSPLYHTASVMFPLLWLHVTSWIPLDMGMSSCWAMGQEEAAWSHHTALPCLRCQHHPKGARGALCSTLVPSLCPLEQGVDDLAGCHIACMESYPWFSEVPQSRKRSGTENREYESNPWQVSLDLQLIQVNSEAWSCPKVSRIQ